MKRVVVINVRITALVDDKINHYADKLHLTRSTLVYKALIYYLASKGYKTVENELNLQKQMEITKTENHYLYLTKNAFMTIINMSKVKLLVNGELDYKLIEHLVKSYLRIYRYFPVNIKKLLKKDMEKLKLLRKKPYIMQYINNWDLIREFVIVKKGSEKRLELK